jgi:hypothetical protein
MADETQLKQQLEILASPRVFPHFRYPIGVPSELMIAVLKAIQAEFGSNPGDSPYLEWVRKLQRNGLIPGE